MCGKETNLAETSRSYLEGISLVDCNEGNCIWKIESNLLCNTTNAVSVQKLSAELPTGENDVFISWKVLRVSHHCLKEQSDSELTWRCIHWFVHECDE